MLTPIEQIEAERLFRETQSILKRYYRAIITPDVAYARQVAFEEALERYGFRRTQ